MKWIVPLHLSYIRVWKLFCKAVDLFAYALSIWFWDLFKRFCSRYFNLYPIFQSSSSFFSSSHGIGSPGSFLAFQASSISIWSSSSCNNLSSLIDTIAAIGSPRRVRTNDSSPHSAPQETAPLSLSRKRKLAEKMPASIWPRFKTILKRKGGRSENGNGVEFRRFFFYLFIVIKSHAMSSQNRCAGCLASYHM